VQSTYPGNLTFLCRPGKKVDASCTLHGEIEEGAIQSRKLEIAAEDLTCQFAYCFEENTLDFYEGEGTLILGSGSTAERYQITPSVVCFTDLKKNLLTFDLHLDEGETECLHLAGEGYSTNSAGFILSVDAAHSHIDQEPLTYAQLCLNDCFGIDLFELEMTLPLPRLLVNLRRTAKTGCLAVSDQQLDRWIHSEASGRVAVDLHYDVEEDLFVFNAEGQELTFDTHKINEGVLIGKKQKSCWTIEQLRLDQFSLSADVEVIDSQWKIGFLGFRLEECILAGFSGVYDTSNHIFDGEINLLEVEIEKVNEWKPLLTSHNIKGSLRGSGSLFLDLGDFSTWGRWKSRFQADLKNMQVAGMPLSDTIGASISVISDEEIVIENIHTALLDAENRSEQAAINLEKLRVDFTARTLNIENMAFAIVAPNLGWIADSIQQRFKEEKLTAIVRNLKDTDTVQGKLDCQVTADDFSVRISLDEDDYSYQGKTHHLSEFSCLFTPQSLSLSSQYQLHDHNFWLAIKTTDPSMQKGILLFADEDPFHVNTEQMLTVSWIYDALKEEFVVSEAAGSFSGFQVALEQADEKQEQCQLFDGIVSVDFQKASFLFSEAVAKQIATWKIGAGYCFEGRWTFPKQDWLSFSFNGDLHSEKIEVGEATLGPVLATVSYSPKATKIKDLLIDDLAAHVQVKMLMIDENEEGEWVLLLPKVLITDLHPSLLQKKGMRKRGLCRNFVVQELLLENIEGYLPYKKSFVGSGHLHFINPSKANKHNTLFSIPGDLLARLGLRLDLLNPVVGKVNYQLRDGKVYITSLEDVFSHGRASRFYLARGGSPSYVDFDGNVNLKVRMKQYNLIFKIAEIFTVTVQGTLQKPNYSLQKQPEMFAEEESFEQMMAPCPGGLL